MIENNVFLIPQSENKYAVCAFKECACSYGLLLFVLFSATQQKPDNCPDFLNCVLDYLLGATELLLPVLYVCDWRKRLRLENIQAGSGFLRSGGNEN